MGMGMGMGLLLLASVAATNFFSLYHLLSSTTADGDAQVPEHLLRQLHTIRATITHLNGHHHSNPDPPPPELLLYSSLAPVASSCAAHPDLLRRYMSYTPFAACPHPDHAAEPLILRGCHPLPRRRCFSLSSPRSPPLRLPGPFAPLPDHAPLTWTPAANCASFSCLPKHLGFDLSGVESRRFMAPQSALDLSLPQLLSLAAAHGAAPLRLGLDVGGGTGTLAARLKQLANATVLTTTMDLGYPYSETAALRGVVPLHAPLQQRFPVADGVLDLVRLGHAVNRWIPSPALEFLLYDADRVLRGGGLLWVDHFQCKGPDLEGVYKPMLRRLGYRTIKWAVADKNDAAGAKNRGEVYATALMQKPFPVPFPATSIRHH